MTTAPRTARIVEVRSTVIPGRVRFAVETPDGFRLGRQSLTSGIVALPPQFGYVYETAEEAEALATAGGFDLAVATVTALR